MSVNIRGGGSFQNSSTPWLTPQILVDINLEVSESSQGSTILGYNRVINAEIQLIYIAEAEISAQLEKVSAMLADGLSSDWNPEERPNVTDSEVLGTAYIHTGINPTNFQVGLQIDKTQEVRYVSVWIQSQKLKIEYAVQAFQRVKTYVLAALAS